MRMVLDVREVLSAGVTFGRTTGKGGGGRVVLPSVMLAKANAGRRYVMMAIVCNM